MAEQNITPALERATVSAFNFINARPILWNSTVKVGASVASSLIKNGKMPINIGATSEWTEARDLPEPDGESFRSWFKSHQKK